MGEDLGTLAASYFESFESRDLESCLAFYSDESSLTFHTGSYKGLDAIEAWHSDRFNADLRIVDMDSMRVQDGTVSLNVVVTSKRLKAWRINTLNGHVELCFDGDKIAQAVFSLRSG